MHICQPNVEDSEKGLEALQYDGAIDRIPGAEMAAQSKTFLPSTPISKDPHSLVTDGRKNTLLC